MSLAPKKPKKPLTPEAHTIQFDRGSITTQIHVNECAALNLARGIIGRARFALLPWGAEEMADLIERGFKVKVCKCCR